MFRISLFLFFRQNRIFWLWLFSRIFFIIQVIHLVDSKLIEFSKNVKIFKIYEKTVGTIFLLRAWQRVNVIQIYHYLLNYRNNLRFFSKLLKQRVRSKEHSQKPRILNVFFNYKLEILFQKPGQGHRTGPKRFK